MAMGWIVVMAGVCIGVYGAAMRATPGRGWVKVCEKGFMGLIGLALGNVALGVLGVGIVQTPISALLSGYLGIPGALLAWVIQRMP